MIHVNHMTNLSFARRYRSKACKQRSIRLFTNQNIAILLLKVQVRNVLSSNTIRVPCCRIVRETYLMTHVMCLHSDVGEKREILGVSRRIT